jgi:hypothetical protein
MICWGKSFGRNRFLRFRINKAIQNVKKIVSISSEIFEDHDTQKPSKPRKGAVYELYMAFESNAALEPLIEIPCHLRDLPGSPIVQRYQ